VTVLPIRLRAVALAAAAALCVSSVLRAEEAKACSEEETNRVVDAAVASLAAKLAAVRKQEAVADPPKPGKEESLAEVKAAAVPRLVQHLAAEAADERWAALRLLETSWSSAARAPVIERLGDADQLVRNQSAQAVRVNVSRLQLGELLAGFLEAKNLKLAVPVFELAEQKQPDVERLKKLMAIPEFHKVMERYLPRYYDPGLTPATLLLLDSADRTARRAAVVGLIQQDAAAAEARSRLSSLLDDPDAEVREAAAEYLLWHGTAGELPALEKAAGAERDAHALAAVRAAAASVAARVPAKIKADAPEDPEADDRPAPADYREALLLLRARPGARSRDLAREVLRTREPFEPINIYAGREPEAAFAGPRIQRMRLTGKLFGFSNDGGTMARERPADLPAAGTLSPPVRDYFDPARRSFGLEMSDDPDQTFSSSVHVGDDVAWFKDGRTVVAIGDGVVRKVSHSPSWGHIVIVEHRLPGKDSWCCSLYAHLSPAIGVSPGEVVRRGQRLGSTGRSRSWENGGYWSHLHFGIHGGPYLDSHPAGEAQEYTLSDGTQVAGKVVAAAERTSSVRVEHMGESVTFDVARECGWVCGYTGKANFKAGQGGWVDPQKFIRERLEAPGQKPDNADGKGTAGLLEPPRRKESSDDG
jgi:murein DD-endopeptidase MepM/ murein hydrolase activator NlpD